MSGTKKFLGAFATAMSLIGTVIYLYFRDSERQRLKKDLNLQGVEFDWLEVKLRRKQLILKNDNRLLALEYEPYIDNDGFGRFHYFEHYSRSWGPLSFPKRRLVTAAWINSRLSAQAA